MSLVYHIAHNKPSNVGKSLRNHDDAFANGLRYDHYNIQSLHAILSCTAS